MGGRWVSDIDRAAGVAADEQECPQTGDTTDGKGGLVESCVCRCDSVVVGRSGW